MNQTIATAEKNLYLTLLALRPHYPILDEWLTHLPKWLAHIKDKSRYANAPYYQSLIEKLPTLHHQTPKIILDQDTVSVLFDWQSSEQKKTLSLIKQLMPWRKGPFLLGDINTDKQIFIDTEWRSDWKWQRVKPHIQPLTGKRVLDVGGGSGYHGWRMAGEGANTVIIIDPSCLFYHQFMLIRHFMGNQDHNEFGQPRVHYIPVALEELPPQSQLFHTVFSMGVFYHRASPFEHLNQLKGQLLSGGELILETLVVDGDETTVLVPEQRYAQMNNVYFLPSILALQKWLEKVGFVDVRCVDVCQTSTEEQRQTEFMDFHSLADFLNPNDIQQTIEGYPAPTRAIIIAQKP